MRAGGIHWAARMDAGGFVEGARRVRASTKSLQRDLSGFDELNETLKNTFGRGSALKEGFEILAGGGAIAGLGLAARGFKDVAESIGEMVSAMKEGKKSASELWEGFITGIPIVGDTTKGLKALLDTSLSLFGLKTSEEIKAVDAKMAAMFQGRESIASQTDSIRQSIAKEADRLGARTPAEKAAVDAKQQADDEAEKINKLREAALKNARDSGWGGREIAAIEDEYRKLRLDSDRNRVEKERQLQRDLEAEGQKADAKASGDKKAAAEHRMSEEQKFNAAAEQVDRELRQQPLIGFNDQLTENIKAYAKMQEDKAKALRNSIVGRAKSLLGIQDDAMGRTLGAATRGSSAALSLMANRNNDPQALTAERMKQLIELVKRQLKIEEDAQRAWEVAYGEAA